MKPFDPTKPVQTRCGKPAAIIATDLKCETFPIVARFFEQGGDRELVASYTKDGMCYPHSPSGNDIINIPEKVKVKFWVNLYRDKSWTCHSSREFSDNYGENQNRIACICIDREVTEGEGL